MKRLSELSRQGEATADEAYAARRLADLPPVDPSEEEVDRAWAAYRARRTSAARPRRPVYATALVCAAVALLLFVSTVGATIARRWLDGLANRATPASGPGDSTGPAGDRTGPAGGATGPAGGPTGALPVGATGSGVGPAGPPRAAPPSSSGSATGVAGPAPLAGGAVPPAGAVVPATPTPGTEPAGVDPAPSRSSRGARAASAASPARAASAAPPASPTASTRPAVPGAPRAAGAKVPLDDDDEDGDRAAARRVDGLASGNAGGDLPRGRSDGSLVYRALEALESGHDPAGASARASEYLRRSPDGPFAEEALFILLHAESRRDPARARAAAADYLRRFPAGRYRTAASKVLSSRD